MKEVLKKDILEILTKTINILEVKEKKDIEELKALSDHAVDDIALYKDLDVISLSVLIYALYKIIAQLPEKDYKALLIELKNAKQGLETNIFGKYNRSIKNAYDLIRKGNVKIKEYLEDVMVASRVKKGTILLKRGLSLGQAAGLMGLSNWDLQQYAGKTMVLSEHHEAVPAKQRLATALKIFNLGGTKK